ncbi:MAG TPA: rhamnogalacturonan acetylesterase [Pirellulales bacterium]
MLSIIGIDSGASANLLGNTMRLGVTTAVFAAIVSSLTFFAGDTSSQEPQASGKVVSNSPREKLSFTNADPMKIDPKLPTLFIAGDSTAAKNNDADHRGWGAVLVDYFDTSKINLVNQAAGGRSFPSYVREGKWDRVVEALKPGDFVVIEFGHNGGHLPGTGDETGEATQHDGSKQIVHTYGWYTRKFIQDARAKGATPIVSSTTVRNIWHDGKVERGMGQMLVWAKQVAGEEQAPFIDHSNITADLYEKMDEQEVAKFFPADHTHTSTDGAVLNAETLIAGLKALPGMPLVEYLNEKGREIMAYEPSVAAAESAAKRISEDPQKPDQPSAK